MRRAAERGGKTNSVWLPTSDTASLHQGWLWSRVSRLCRELVSCWSDTNRVLLSCHGRPRGSYWYCCQNCWNWYAAVGDYQSAWVDTYKKLFKTVPVKHHSLASHLYGYYSVFSFLHILWSITCSWQSFSTTSLHVFFGLPWVLCPPLHNPCIFTRSFSSFLETCLWESQPISLYHCKYVVCCLLDLITWESVCYCDATHPPNHSDLTLPKYHHYCFE